ncbi:ABC transporter substrate-binding protein [Acuticoccus sp. M5D2P5]|uniref:ABC transporter substrate-binding protein n=1 Tax=Acuticoccus kalidii TaxID=2910977 RepID=UPI001F217742|nr:ABC transporter substrate-binding protein [Acuticoccus kalidii]MCF3934846.1 ABC transporter substrate-binding protein [Acuticoccus kalidii]
MSRLTIATMVASGCVLALATTASAQDLNVWSISYNSDAQRNALRGAAAAFEEKNPGTNVEITMRGTDEHKTALRVSAGSDRGPDIYLSWAGRGLGGEYVLAGLSRDLTEYYEGTDLADRFSTPALAFVDQFGDGMHGVPFRFTGEAVMYDKRAFEKAGITEEPQSYEELVAAAEALKEAGIPAFAFGGTVNWHLMRLMDNILEAVCDAETHDALMEMQLDWRETPCAEESFAELEMWANNYILSPFMGIDNKQAFSLFVGQRAAMVLETDSQVNTLVEAGADLDDYGLFKFPTPSGRLYGFAEYLYVSSKTQNPELAMAFIDMFTGAEYQSQIKGAFGALPVNVEVDPGSDNELYNTWLTLLEEAPGTFVNGDQAFPLDVTTEYFRVINQVATGDLTPAEAADAMATFIDNRD